MSSQSGEECVEQEDIVKMRNQCCQLKVVQKVDLPEEQHHKWKDRDEASPTGVKNASIACDLQTNHEPFAIACVSI